jgi:hypothetical protein
VEEQRTWTSHGAALFEEICKLIVFAVVATLIAHAQDAPIRFQIAFRQTRTAIASKCGKPFGLWRENATDFNASSIGVPIGPWSVYHLTPFEGRMYVTILHFDPQEKIDAVMLQPNGTWTATQILKDHPSIARICAESCDVIQVPETGGNTSLLLKPKSTASQNGVLFFIGDRGTRYKSVSSMDSFVSWGYVLSQSDFEKHHAGLATKIIGSWRP